MQLGTTAEADTRYTFTTQFLEASVFFVRRAREIEVSSPNTIDHGKWCEHRGLVCSVIMQCAAALETEAHETCKYGPGAYVGLDDARQKERDVLLPVANIVDQQSTISRFDLILHLLQRKALDRGRHPYQSAALVVRLRNEIAHYKSHWGMEMEKKSLFDALQSLGHSAPPFTTSDMNFFPHRCLSADCATWALASVVEFLEHFYDCLGVSSRFRDCRSRLDP